MKPAWPYFGAKTCAAETIWRLLGNPSLYIEPFCGTCAALLGRPGWRPGIRRSEIVNDADGLLVNTLRAIRYRPSIVVCGYAGDHPALEQAGWAVHCGTASGSGYSHVSATSREAIWASPACASRQPLLC